MALTKFPIMNTFYYPEKPFEYTTLSSHNITIAMDSPNGLVVPNLKDC